MTLSLCMGLVERGRIKDKRLPAAGSKDGGPNTIKKAARRSTLNPPLQGSRVLGDDVTDAADVFALGCVMWEMAHQGCAFLSDKTDAQVGAGGASGSVQEGGKVMGRGGVCRSLYTSRGDLPSLSQPSLSSLSLILHTHPSNLPLLVQVSRAKGRSPMQMPEGTPHLAQFSSLAQRCR